MERRRDRAPRVPVGSVVGLVFFGIVGVVGVFTGRWVATAGSAVFIVMCGWTLQHWLRFRERGGSDGTDGTH